MTDLGSGCWPSSAVATIETLINPSKLSSVIAPIINSASGSTSALIYSQLHLLHNNFKSLPPVILTKSPFALLKNNRQSMDY